MRLLVLAVLAGVLSLAGCDAITSESKKPEPIAAPASPAAVLAAELKMREWDLESRKLDQALRLQVARVCAAKGMIPVIVNGNVDCKTAGK